MRIMWIWSAMFAAACGEVTGEIPDAPVLPDGPVGAGEDAAPVGRCDPAKPFGAATLVPNINSPDDEQAFGLTADELTAFVSHVVQVPNLDVRVVAALRTSIDEDFGAVTNGLTGALNAVDGQEAGGSPTGDGATLYFQRQIGSRISAFAAARGTADKPYDAGASVRLGLAVLTDALGPTISADGQTLYWVDAVGDFVVRAAARNGGPAAFAPARKVSTFAIQSPAVLSADELTLFYSLGTAADDVHVTTRASTTELFSPGVPVPNVSSARRDIPVALTRDGCILYLASDRPGGVGGLDIWEARRPR